MKSKLMIITTVALLLAGCSSYKELSPEPEINPKINGYIKIKDGKENFELEKGKKYYLAFKKPVRDNVYLMIKNNIKPFSEYYFTGKFLKEPGYKVIPHLTATEKELSVFPLDTLHKKFYWVIEKIEKDTILSAEYRYIESWRFGFERDYQKDFSLFNKVKIDREKYSEVNLSRKLTDLQSKLNQLRTKFDTLTALRQRAAAMEKYFPSEYRTAKDYDYKKYLIFENDVEEEFLFQKKSLSLLSAIVELKKTENQPELFLQNIPTFYNFLKNSATVDKSLKNKVKEIIASRLLEAEKFYEKTIIKKVDTEPFEMSPPLDEVANLYKEVNGFVPQSFLKYKEFFESFDKKANELKNYSEYEKQLKDYLSRAPKWIPERYFNKALNILNKMAENLPEVHPSSFGDFKNYTCVTILTAKAKKIKRGFRKFEREIKEANFVVAQINNLRKEGAYDEIISLLKNNTALVFLRKHYAFLDYDFLKNEEKKINGFLNEKNWARAENEIRKLSEFNRFLNEKEMTKRRDSLAVTKADRLFRLVKIYTQARIDSVLQTQTGAYENLDSLYLGKVFAPDFVFSFDPRGNEFVEQRNNELESYVNKIKFYEFPEKSILKLYNEILRNSNSDGVPKARAILYHARFYRGSNKKVKNIIDEFNVNVAKTIKQAKVYRKLYALPVTDNAKGENIYKFRVVLKIPTQAQFPVYEINIKLPEEIAKNAANQKWYEKITLNGEELKNEGRIKIIAPTASNDYECKISPVQMDAGGRNILEVTFKFPSYKIYEISVMAQKPLIRKN